ncbi:MAG: hypothetical protein NVS9B14_01160 [Candidatus Acidiferrum sp.]
MTKGKKSRTEVFLNVPYDPQFDKLFLAYIAGLTAYRMVPRATLEITDSSRRLEKILTLERRCKYSIHDLSRVQLSQDKPRTPRFNMPFELGLCVADANRKAGQKQDWFVLEGVSHRLNKALSDLDGTDPRIHENTVQGVLSSLASLFKRPGQQPTVPQMLRIYRALRRDQPSILKKAGSKTLYNKRVFVDICVAANTEADRALVD